MAGRAVAWRCLSCDPLLHARTPGPHSKGPTCSRAPISRKSHDGAPLFDGVSLTLDDGARAALVGVNGVGKTTLIRLLAGVDRPDRGAVALGAGDRVGYLPQDVLDPASTIDDLLRRALGEVWEVRLRLDELERDLTDLDAYGEAQARFEALDGWALEARLDEARRRLGIEHLDRGALLGRVSGGEAARCLLAAGPARRPDRAAARRAHQPPRRRRPRLADRVARGLHRHAADGLARPRLPRRHRRPRPRALAPQGIEVYEGGYTAYKEERERRRERLALAVEAQDKRRRRLEADIATTSRQAAVAERSASKMGAAAPHYKRLAAKVAKKSKVREHRLQREMAAEDWLRMPRDPAAFKVKLPGGRAGPPARRRAARRRGRRRLRRRRRDAARRRPRRAGRPQRGGQEHAPAPALRRAGARRGRGRRARHGPAAPADARRGCPPSAACSTGSASRRALPEDEARTLLAHYRLGAEAIARPLGRLSPGERARVHVAAMVAAGADLILLDEPTNHLDFDTLEVIEAALRAYRGTLVVASHDRALHEAIDCDRVIEVRDGGVAVNDRFQVCHRTGDGTVGRTGDRGRARRSPAAPPSPRARSCAPI